MCRSTASHIWSMTGSNFCKCCAGVLIGIYGICLLLSPVLFVQGTFHRYLGIMYRSTDRHIWNMAVSVSSLECTGYSFIDTLEYCAGVLIGIYEICL